MPEWEVVIGLEVHVQLATASKAFSASATRFGSPPNSLTDPTVLGLPGCLPVFNARALELAITLGLATGCTIRPISRFARKHYFYPDLPKGYQISQYDEPLCEGGAIAIGAGAATRPIRLLRIHLEEDAGKNTHAGATSRVDLNRAGVPLCEVVSEPDLRSAAEAGEYLRTLHQLVRWLEVSDGDMEKGQLRCDANVSLRPRGQAAYGTRTELKNINSFRFVEAAITHEVARQARILDGGGTIEQETRLWDADAGASQSMRSKEEALDYRYFPDPDLPPLEVDADTLARLRAALPELPAARRARYLALGLAEIDAHQLTSERAVAEWYDAALAAGAPAKAAAHWMTGELFAELNRAGVTLAGCKVQPAGLAALLALVADGTLSGKLAKQVFAEMVATGEAPAAIADRLGLRQLSDAGELETIAAAIVAANARQADGYRAGNTKLFGFFVGQVMKATGGKANPQLINEILSRLLA